MKRRNEKEPPEENESDDDMDIENLESVTFPLMDDDLSSDLEDENDKEEKSFALPLVSISAEPNGWDDQIIITCFDQCLQSYGDKSHDHLEEKYPFSPLSPQEVLEQQQQQQQQQQQTITDSTGTTESNQNVINKSTNMGIEISSTANEIAVSVADKEETKTIQNEDKASSLSTHSNDLTPTNNDNQFKESPFNKNNLDIPLPEWAIDPAFASVKLLSTTNSCNNTITTRK